LSSFAVALALAACGGGTQPAAADSTVVVPLPRLATPAGTFDLRGCTFTGRPPLNKCSTGGGGFIEDLAGTIILAPDHAAVWNSVWRITIFGRPPDLHDDTLHGTWEAGPTSVTAIWSADVVTVFAWDGRDTLRFGDSVGAMRKVFVRVP
jgi:hypothetical protein